MELRKITLILNVGLHYFFVGLFIYSAFEKAINFIEFRMSLTASELFTDLAAKYLVYFVPTIELIAALLLLLYKRIGYVFSLTVFVFFTLYLIVLEVWYSYSSCGCGGIFNEMSFEWHLTLNVFCIIALIYLYFRTTKNKILNHSI